LPAKGAYLAIAGGGAVLLWSGLRGKSWTAVIRDLIAGKNPAQSLAANPIMTASSPSGGGGGGTNTGTGSGSAIADDALRYKGHSYVWGGAPGANAQNGWDCSSFANYVLGHDFNYTLPGASKPGYDGSSHGPTTISYLVWATPKRVATTTPARAALLAQPGDILVDATHMGFAIGGGNMVSALNMRLGTTVSDIAGTMIAPTTVERLLCR
jgi:cell wall-associated NlpC family hydrolase